jgi:hypothetical protein
MTSAYHFGVVSLRFLQSSDMFLWDDQHVRGSLRVDVFKGKHVLVFVDFLRRNLTAENAAEKTIAAGVGHQENSSVSIALTPRSTKVVSDPPPVVRSSAKWAEHRRLVEPHQKHGAFLGFRFCRDFLGTLVIVVENAYPYPPIARGTRKAQNLCGVIAAG